MIMKDSIHRDMCIAIYVRVFVFDRDVSTSYCHCSSGDGADLLCNTISSTVVTCD